jgi:hypothetical protein
MTKEKENNSVLLTKVNDTEKPNKIKKSFRERLADFFERVSILARGYDRHASAVEVEEEPKLSSDEIMKQTADAVRQRRGSQTSLETLANPINLRRKKSRRAEKKDNS